MTDRVRADTLQVGDIVVLPSQLGDLTLKIRAVTAGSASIKFVAQSIDRLQETAGQTHWGWPPDHLVEIVERGN